jgi:hypothetical protein
VFAGGFDLQSACAVADSGDEYTILDRFDALVRKSLLVADRSSGHTRYSMLETIRQFAEDQLVDRGEATEIRTRHAHCFARRETDIMALWDSPRQREAYGWFRIELANLRTAFRWAADHGDVDVAAPIATFGTILGNLAGNYEPIAWAEELIEPARALDHPRLVALYEMASHCYFVGRMEEGLRYSDAGQALLETGRDYDLPFGGEAVLIGPYLSAGQPERVIEWCRAQLARGRDHVQTRTMLVAALKVAGEADEAITTAGGLIAAAEDAANPWALSYALFAYGFALRDVDPAEARLALRRGLMLARDSGNRFIEAGLAVGLSDLEATVGDTIAALDHLILGIRIFDDAGNTAMIRVPLAVLTVLLDRLGWYEPAAIVAGFAVDPLSTASIPDLTTAITHLRDVLGEQTYQSLAHKAETLTTAELVAYAYDQIDQARAELNAVAE